MGSISTAIGLVAMVFGQVTGIGQSYMSFKQSRQMLAQQQQIVRCPDGTQAQLGVQNGQQVYVCPEPKR